jgi:GT2 family glycosyltransferase
MTNAPETGAPATIDAVVIGRNEGARLIACLASLKPQVRRIVYVDSGSRDDSVNAARAAGATVVDLDMSRGFTAARARNAGLARLSEQDSEFVQLVDGDCTVQPGWVAAAAAFLAAAPGAAIACGRRREAHPGASVYNRLCDREWDTPAGAARACGGDALLRLAPVMAVGGFNDTLIAGEEPELCLRLRRAGWTIRRLDAEMTIHDANITRFGQWWQRTRRAGHAYGEGAHMHGAPPDRHWVKETRRALIWGVALPALALLPAFLTPFALLLFLAYPAQVVRLAWRDGPGRRASWEMALFSVMGKFPEAQGILDFHRSRWRGRKTRLLEYK